MSFERLTLDPSSDPPLGERRRWFEAPGMMDTAGQSFSLTPEGRVLYVQAREEKPPTWLRVVPDRVARMERAVDQANR